MKKLSITLLTLLLFTSTIAYAQNPLFTKTTTKEANKTNNEKFKTNTFYPNFIQKILYKSNIIQQKLNKKITSLIKKNTSKSIFLFFFFSFIYGIIHALGPGHGKSIISSYFISRKSKIKNGFFAGILIAFIHSFSAIATVGVIYFFMKKTILSNFENMSYMIKKISFSAIIIIGLFLFFKAIYELLQKKRKNDKDDLQNSKKNRSIFAIALTIGIVPCPGATMILLFTLSYNLFAFGIIAVLFMSIGMALTISSFAISTIFIKNYSSKFIPSQNKFKRLFLNSTEIFGSLLILSIGLLLFNSI